MADEPEVAGEPAPVVEAEPALEPVVEAEAHDAEAASEPEPVEEGPAEPAPAAEPVAAEAPGPEPVVGLASQPVHLVPQPPEAMPSKISDAVTPDSEATTRHRVAIWLAETKYFLSTLQHEVAGEHGELIARLKERL